MSKRLHIAQAGLRYLEARKPPADDNSIPDTERLASLLLLISSDEEKFENQLERTDSLPYASSREESLLIKQIYEDLDSLEEQLREAADLRLHMAKQTHEDASARGEELVTTAMEAEDESTINTATDEATTLFQDSARNVSAAKRQAEATETQIEDLLRRTQDVIAAAKERWARAREEKARAAAAEEQAQAEAN